jgi:hypothetical protein
MRGAESLTPAGCAGQLMMELFTGLHPPDLLPTATHYFSIKLYTSIYLRLHQLKKSVGVDCTQGVHPLQYTVQYCMLGVFFTFCGKNSFPLHLPKKRPSDTRYSQQQSFTENLKR